MFKIRARRDQDCIPALNSLGTAPEMVMAAPGASDYSLDTITVGPHNNLMRHRLARYWRLLIGGIALGGGAAAFFAQQASMSGKVAILIEAEDRQPVGMPLVIHVQVRNTGDEPIPWWCGIGSRLPAASCFQVEIKHPSDSEWKTVIATNGEADEGSGRIKMLEVGGALAVPLALPLRPQSVAGHLTERSIFVDSVSVRVRSSLDASKSTAEAQVSIYHDRQLAETRQRNMIRGIIDGSDSFWKHVATYYAEAVVLDVCARLAGADNRGLADAACQLLARQPSLPESLAAELVRISRKWAKEGDLDASFITAALATKTEIARQTAFDLLVEKPNDITAFRVVDALRLSPGDTEWMKQVRTELEEFYRRGLRDERLNANTLQAIQWVNQRLEKMSRK
jgi:hypothetical protein